MSLIKGLSW